MPASRGIFARSGRLPGAAQNYADGMATLPVDDEMAAAFARDGVACVRGVLDPAELAVAARAIAIVRASPGPLAQVASAADDPGSFFEDFCRWREIPEIELLARYSRVPQVAAALMSTLQARLYHDHVLVKEGGTRQRTPWHQDQPYYNVDGRGVSAWMPRRPRLPLPRPAAGAVAALPVRRCPARAPDLAHLPALRRPRGGIARRVGHGPPALPRRLAPLRLNPPGGCRYRYLKPSRKRRNTPPSMGSGAAGAGAVARWVATGWS